MTSRRFGQHECASRVIPQNKHQTDEANVAPEHPGGEQLQTGQMSPQSRSMRARDICPTPILVPYYKREMGLAKSPSSEV
jgi:hypothetical protein